jgi:hypothetical protein
MTSFTSETQKLKQLKGSATFGRMTFGITTLSIAKRNKVTIKAAE